jgi:hypothetical protein
MGTSSRRDWAEITARLRQEGKSWVEIAAALRERHGINARVAFRWAHGWSQSQVADAWCERWPDDPKTFKSISYWERWPESGHAPSLSTLDRLAQLYECNIADLVEDLPGHRQLDTVGRAGEQARRLWQSTSGSMSLADASEVASAIEQVSVMSVDELAQSAIAFTHQLGMSAADRKPMLVKLSAALSLAATAPHLADLEAADTGADLSAGPDLSGVWLSRYRYPSGDDELEGQHYVVLRQQADRVVAHSLPHSNGSRLKLDLTFQPPVATGTGLSTRHRPAATRASPITARSS